jgi:uncharacterized phosphosugar-binding protein
VERYIAKVKEILTTVILTQKEGLNQVAECCTNAILANKQLFFFGTGHSHMLAEEAFYRAGGLMNITPILETGLMLHEGGTKSTKLERMEGYAAILIEEYKVGKDDVIFIISNSGLNAVPVEMALGAKQLGATVIAITNLQQSQQAKPRHASGKKLYEIADIVLDNCGLVGDASVYMDSLKLYVGPTSTVIGAFMINSIVVQVVENCINKGYAPQVYVSANLEEGDDHNAKLLENTRPEGIA